MSEGEFAERPTWSRWRIVAVCTLMSLLLYLDRFCVSFAEKYIQDDLSLSKEQVAGFTSAFFWTYALMQVPSGWLSDRWGGRITLTFYIAAWSVCTLLMGFANTFWVLLLMRCGLGIAQAGAYPTSAGILRKWMPLKSRGTASSFVAFGGRAGAVLAPILTALLIVQLVPLSQSPLLTTNTLRPQELIAWNQKRAKTPAETGSVTDLVWNGLPEKTRQTLQQLPTASAGSTSTLNPEQHATIVEGFNQVIQQAHLQTATDVRKLTLLQEVRPFLEQTALEEVRQQRVNRLILEAAYPKLMIQFYTRAWRPVLMIYGAAGLLIALAFWVLVRNHPAEHPGCNAAEVELIAAGSAPVPTPNAVSNKVSIPWKSMLTSRSLWASSVSQFGTNLGWGFVVLAFPRYLEEIFQVEIQTRGLMSSLPPAAGILGMLLGGPLTDTLRVRIGLRWGRSLPMGLTRFGAVLSFVGMIFARDAWTATFFACLVSFFTDLGVAATWAFIQDAGGKVVGVILGWGNMWGNFGAAALPLVQARILSDNPTLSDYHTVFVVCGIAFLISGIAGLTIDARKPIAEG